jgi:putative transposase
LAQQIQITPILFLLILTLNYILPSKDYPKTNHMQYRRTNIPGASYFFTLTLQDRQSSLLTEKINELRFSFQHVMQSLPFMLDGIVILPDHMHLIMTLPPNDLIYSQRISFIKSTFSRQLQTIEPVSSSRQTKRERGIWQRRFWEHFIRDEQDYIHHMNYIHFNPVKHGYVESPAKWAYSSIHRYIKLGVLSSDWGCNDVAYEREFGE